MDCLANLVQTAYEPVVFTLADIMLINQTEIIPILIDTKCVDLQFTYNHVWISLNSLADVLCIKFTEIAAYLLLNKHSIIYSKFPPGSGCDSVGLVLQASSLFSIISNPKYISNLSARQVGLLFDISNYLKKL